MTTATATATYCKLNRCWMLDGQSFGLGSCSGDFEALGPDAADKYIIFAARDAADNDQLDVKVVR